MDTISLNYGGGGHLFKCKQFSVGTTDALLGKVVLIIARAGQNVIGIYP